MAIPSHTITEEQIRSNTSAQSFESGAELSDAGAVSGLTINGRTLTGSVEAGRHGPFQVSVSFNVDGTTAADCDCPYRFDLWCAHIAAVLLRYLNEPDDEETISPLDAILSALHRDDLQALILRLADNHPELTVELQIELSRLKLGSAPMPLLADARSEAHLISISEVRKQVRNALIAAARTYNQGHYLDDDDYAVMSTLRESIDPLLEMVELCTDVGDIERAMSLLEAITHELISGWHTVSDYIYEPDDLYFSVGDNWAYALLAGDLSLEVRQEWLAKIESWRQAGSDFGADGCLAHASRAATEGWDNPTMMGKLSGELLNAEFTAVAPDEVTERLTPIRLEILERQGRLEDAARLALAESLHDEYMELLVRLGSAREAVAHSRHAITTAKSALRLAKGLHAHNEPKLALRVAERGLEFADGIYALAVWTRDAANSEGQRDLAIRTGMLAIMADSTLEDYIGLKSISDDLWPGIREHILTHLCSLGCRLDSEQADILMYEGLLLEALNGVADSFDYRLVERVVEACLPVYPHSVIPVCKHQAESIISTGKSNRYHHAIKWLSLARGAYLNAKCTAAWIAYKDDLMKQHSRKSSLMPGLRSL